ncbi:MAG: CRISPR-associated endonuclease Cas1 [Actinomycetota bacterium]|nr:CRISPR-associated endonuclease Cas1 [Actinomycetota bacterium]
MTAISDDLPTVSAEQLRSDLTDQLPPRTPCAPRVEAVFRWVPWEAFIHPHVDLEQAYADDVIHTKSAADGTISAAAMPAATFRVPWPRLRRLADQARGADNFATLLGIEGTAARLYFAALPSMLAEQAAPFGAEFSQLGRNRRPPLDPLNALLSFCYSMLTKDLVAVTLGVGLDPYLGVYHRSRYGRPALCPFRG